MKNIIIIITCTYMLSACSIFRKNTKYGCPTDGRNVGAEKLAAGDPKVMKAARKAKWKGGY
ncbi:MAG TPA: hypothetical protein VGP43_04320 [Chitinophagaceae bacterium]|nr:hypothetical protein [Chitinophagaceae bacterium]